MSNIFHKNCFLSHLLHLFLHYISKLTIFRFFRNTNYSNSRRRLLQLIGSRSVQLTPLLLNFSKLFASQVFNFNLTKKFLLNIYYLHRHLFICVCVCVCSNIYSMFLFMPLNCLMKSLNELIITFKCSHLYKINKRSIDCW